MMTDSAGHDVFAQRLRSKRNQLAQLVSMIECNPEMVAVAFHDAFRFHDPQRMREIAACESDELPPWSEVMTALELTPWADRMAADLLLETGGDRFLVVSACLEFLRGLPEAASDNTSRMLAPVDDEESDDEYDLDEAGADWLSEQGFDHKERFSGE